MKRGQFRDIFLSVKVFWSTCFATDTNVLERSVKQHVKDHERVKFPYKQIPLLMDLDILFKQAVEMD